MVLLNLLLVLQAAATPLPALPPVRFPTPDAEAERLGRTLAETGTLAALLPLMQAKETEELVAAHPELTEAERVTLRTTAAEVATAGRARLTQATGHAYATRMSVEELRAAVAFEASSAGRARQAATPAAIVETMQGAGPIDFKGETLAALCARTGKACPPKR